MVENRRFSSVDKRAEFEAKYSVLIKAIRLDFEHQRDYSYFSWSEEKKAELSEAMGVVLEALDNNMRGYSIARRFVLSLDERLTMKSEREEKYPHHPVNHNQMLRAIRGIKEEMDGLALGWLHELDASSPMIGVFMDGQGVKSATMSSGREVHIDKKETDYFEILRLRALNLLKQLPLQKAKEFLTKDEYLAFRPKRTKKKALKSA